MVEPRLRSDGNAVVICAAQQELWTLPEEFILHAKSLRRSFGGLCAVNDVTLSVRRGTIHSVIGPNGAGKTTFFNLLTKFLQPTSGSIIFKGQDITDRSPASVSNLGLVRSFQISSVFHDLTVLENVRIALQKKVGIGFNFWSSSRSLRHLDGRVMDLLEMVGLQDVPGMRAGALSYGRKRTLELATTLALEPEMLLLDEPMAGMGREDIEKVASLIKSISKSRTILMIEHNLSVVAKLSDRISVLARGQLIADGDYETVSKNPQVVEAYIGTAHPQHP